MTARFALVAIFNAAIAHAQFLTESDYSYSDSTSAYWTVTTRLVETVATSYYTWTDYSSVDTETYSTTRTIKDSVTPTVIPTSVYTSSAYYYDDVQLVLAYYPTGAVAESDLMPDYYATASSTSTGVATYTSIAFSMPVTMTAPASCPTPFTVTTSASVDVPSIVTHQITPTSTELGSTTYYNGDVWEFQTWWLSASAAPFASTSDYYYEQYISSCSTPPAAYRTGTSSSNNNNDDSTSGGDSCYYYYSYSCNSPLRVWIIVIACLLPGLFLLGFLESWFWFRRLMMGKSAMRFGTVCWVLISLWVMCFTRMQDRRSADDQKLLAEKWKQMGSGAAFKAWWKWGFRHRYPEELLGQFSKTTVGVVPPGQALNSAMAQTPGAFQPGAPGDGALQPVPGAPGQVYYYGPPPPGWVQAPNGGFVPPQGYTYPPSQQAGYYGDMTKDGSVVSHSPVSALGHPAHQQSMNNVSPMSQQAPQPIYPALQNGTHTPTPYGAPPDVGQAPSPPPQRQVPTPPQNAASGAPQLPPVHVSETPADRTPQPASATSAPPPPRNDPNDRSLYE